MLTKLTGYCTKSDILYSPGQACTIEEIVEKHKGLYTRNYKITANLRREQETNLRVELTVLGPPIKHFFWR
jgi:hypothetical protein